MTRRRSSSLVPASITDELPSPKTIELEQRVSRLELKLQRACEELDVTAQRIVALKAQLDHLLAKLGRV